MTKSPNLKINSYQHLEEIFQLTVETIRKNLQCDRVIVYDARELPKSKIVVEAINPQYPSVKETKVIDPFLAEEYLESYCYGQAVAINDISEINVNQSKLKQLAELEVKSLIIAPISVRNKLLAFLIVHQCSKARSWNSEAIRFVTKQAQTMGVAFGNIIEARSELTKDVLLLNDRDKLLSSLPKFTGELIPQVNKNGSTMDGAKRNGNGNGNTQHLEQQTTQSNKTKLFSEVISKIDNERGKGNILNTTVSELRHLLGSDRVVVYSLNEDDYGVVVAESVASGWTKAQGALIDDPCIASKYIEEYQNGRVRAIDDISSQKVSPCYREQLEGFEVKANLVAPIVRQDRLFGLLIAHQCSAPRHWEKEEIDWITEIAARTGLMLEDKISAEDELSESQPLTNDDREWHQRFDDAVEYIRASLKREDILKAGVKEVRRVLMCDRVVVYSLDRNFRCGSVIAESVASGWTRALNKEIDDPCFELGYREKYRHGRVRAWNNIYESSMTKCYLDQLEKLEVKANLVTPIISEGKLFGLLVAHQCSDFRNWQQPEISWVAQIATQVGFALDSAKLLADTKQLQHQLENEVKLTQYFTDATRYIRESLQQEDILEISVEEVRRVLKCDRVVVYSLNHDLRYGSVIAESVAPGWTRALNKEIEDPCFEPTYREKYRDGRVRAWNNIYEADLDRCHVEQLEKLEVKANLVTPIVNQGKLFGLLVAHQCSNFRNWQQSEIRWVTQIATQVGFALDNAKLLAEARHLQQQVQSENRWTEYFTDAIRHIRQSLKTEDILKTSVKEVRRILECDRVVVYSLNHDLRYGSVIAESVAPGWTKVLNKEIEDPCFEPTYREKYRNGRVRAWNNIYEAGMRECHVEQLEKLEVKANLVTPIVNEGKLFGLLVAHQCSDFRNWQQAEIRWIAQIATQVGFALDNARLLEQLQKSTQINSEISNRQQKQTKVLKRQVVEILAKNGDAYQTLSQEAMRQSESTINVLHQIKKVADSFNDIALNVQQLKFQEQQNELAIQNSQESLERAVSDVSNIQHTVKNVVGEFEHIGSSVQKLAETVNTIRDISQQIVQQSMSMTRTVNRSQIEGDSQNSMMDLSDRILALMQQLYEASARVEPLFANIQTEVKEKTITLDSKSQQLIDGASEFQVIGQKLERVATLQNKMNALVENISQSVENQTHSSIFDKDFVREIASIAERISAQSTTITQSFSQLIVLVEKF